MQSQKENKQYNAALSHFDLKLFCSYISPSLTNVFRSVDVIATFALQFYFEPSMTFHPTSLIGIAFLCISAVLIATEEKIMRKYPNNCLF